MQEETTIYQDKRKEGKSRKKSKENVSADLRKRKKSALKLQKTDDEVF